MEPEIYILKSEELEVHVSTLGATLTRILVEKGKSGKKTDVLLGMETAGDYKAPAYTATGAYLGAGIGRYGNRIAGGKFTLNGKEYRLAVNNGPNHLHGGIEGFDKKIWTVIAHSDVDLALQYISPDGEENYPGTLRVEVRFSVTGKELKIDYRAVTDQDCYVNLTHHPYFNLDPSAETVKEHILKLYTDKYLKTEDLIPDGTFVTVSGDYDFTHPRALKGVIEHAGGLDDCFVFENDGKLKKLADLSVESTGIKLYVCSDYPGLQVYTGRYLDVKNARGGRSYGAYAGVALEAQYWPDSPHHPAFPSTLLRPGEEYVKTTIYGFE